MDSIQFNEEKIAGFVTLDTFLIRSLNSTIVVSLLRIPDIFTRANLLDRIILFGEIRFAPLPVSLRNTRTPPLSSCLPTPLSLRSTVFDLSLSRSRSRLSLSLALARFFFYRYLRRGRPLPLPVLLSLPLPLFRPRPSCRRHSTLPSSVIVSSTRFCSPAFAQALNAIYDHRYVLSRHIRSGWSLAFSSRPLFLTLLFSIFLLPLPAPLSASSRFWRFGFLYVFHLYYVLNVKNIISNSHCFKIWINFFLLIIK